MPFRVLISVLETSLLGVFKTGYSWIEMFENIVSGAVLFLVVLFWGLLASIIIWGALWVRSYKKG
jgi:protein-S-isoprenylcysteine O-methyltransferase Ste14